MNSYLDTSIILRKLLNEPAPLEEYPQIKRAFSGRLTRLESFRTLDRLRLMNEFDDRDLSKLRHTLTLFFDRIEWIPLTESVIQQAESAFPTKIATIDSIHLSSAILIRNRYSIDLSFATHDEELGTAAQAMGFEVLGCKTL